MDATILRACSTVPVVSHVSLAKCEMKHLYEVPVLQWNLWPVGFCDTKNFIMEKNEFRKY